MLFCALAFAATGNLASSIPIQIRFHHKPTLPNCDCIQIHSEHSHARCLGVYSKDLTRTYSGKPVYQLLHAQTFLYYSEDSSQWMVGPEVSGQLGFEDRACLVASSAGWEVIHEDGKRSVQQIAILSTCSRLCSTRAPSLAPTSYRHQQRLPLHI